MSTIFELIITDKKEYRLSVLADTADQAIKAGEKLYIMPDPFYKVRNVEIIGSQALKKEEYARQ